ncbi:MAG: hypothetical protein AAFU49_04505 [Pseudomonadota bacterium]
MSMMMTLRRVTEADISALLEDPDEMVPRLRDVDGVEGIAAGLEQRRMEAALGAIP